LFKVHQAALFCLIEASVMSNFFYLKPVSNANEIFMFKEKIIIINHKIQNYANLYKSINSQVLLIYTSHMC